MTFNERSNYSKMRESPKKHCIPIVPKRLHTRSRSKVNCVNTGDCLYIRHEPLVDSDSYGFEIPGHAHLENQSANSRILNEGGYACDVLYDTKQGKHYFKYEIACLDTEDIKNLQLPNKNSIRFDSKGNVKKQADLYFFKVKHDPTELMYPHCIIQACKNGDETTKISKGFKTFLRSKFAELADKNRKEMIHQRAKEFPTWKKEYENLIKPSLSQRLLLGANKGFNKLLGVMRRAG